MDKFIVIMAGGVGSRFWPRSRKTMPKQLLNIFGENTMIQETFYRVKDIVTPENVLIITNKVQKALIEEQLPEIPAKNIIAEPIGKNTAPCIALAAQVINSISNDSVFATLPADHLIGNKEKFIATLNTAFEEAYSNKGLITFGIKPNKPETGYGYINFEKNNSKSVSFKVKKFVEKPNLETAEKYIQSGDYFWNSGMFVWRTDTILNEIKTHLPELDKEISEIQSVIDTDSFYTLLAKIFKSIESVSVDYGIMEKSDKVFMMQGDFDWNDVGSWDTVYDLSSKDDKNNSVTGDVFIKNCSNSYIHSPNKFTAMIGMDNVVLINTDDALLVCNKDNVQEVKDVVDFLTKTGRQELI